MVLYLGACLRAGLVGVVGAVGATGPDGGSLVAGPCADLLAAKAASCAWSSFCCSATSGLLAIAKS